jgi:hypothetical protein
MSALVSQYVSTVVIAIIGLAVAAIGTAITSLKPRINQFLIAHVGKQNAEVIEAVAHEAYSFAESMYANMDGAKKMSQAMNYVTKRLPGYGIELGTDAIYGAVQSAWQKVEGQQKRQVISPTTTQGALPVSEKPAVAPDVPQQNTAQTAVPTPPAPQ